MSISAQSQLSVPAPAVIWSTALSASPSSDNMLRNSMSSRSSSSFDMRHSPHFLQLPFFKNQKGLQGHPIVDALVHNRLPIFKGSQFLHMTLCFFGVVQSLDLSTSSWFRIWISLVSMSKIPP